ncbi:hypothetical protein [Cohnella terricola]|uniref:Uncharacterized protein n=1 Tax=Cohnella terricola TaxID=1289167 RepID=A0A559J5D6_9BACL|nr:hypothetical protein [Cohnella terricola]TVX95104.1 hypothetical protein FPZ45_24185 [Cohnella terricola]
MEVEKIDQLIEIIVQNFDEKSNIVFVEKKGKNIWSMLSLMQFEDDMEYWDMPTHIRDISGRKGFLFDISINEGRIVSEIQRFIDEHNLDKRDFSLY